MKDEIKEILRDLEFASGVFDYTITPDRCTFLQDYITNLQEENKKQKEVIDKAIEYIKEKARNNCWIDQYESCDLIKILKEVD